VAQSWYKASEVCSRVGFGGGRMTFKLNDLQFLKQFAQGCKEKGYHHVLKMVLSEIDKLEKCNK
jgi:hypothetical protein